MDNDENPVVVDIGSAFGEPGLQGRIKSEMMLDALGTMHYDALNLGSSEFNYGVDFLIDDDFPCSSGNDGHVPMVSANIVWEDTGDAITSSFLIKKFEHFTVGIVGIMSGEYGEALTASNEISERKVMLLDPGTSLKLAVQDLGSKVDIIIVLAYAGLDECVTFAEEIEGIDIILCRHSLLQSGVPLEVNGVFIANTATSEGQEIANLRIAIDEDGRIRNVQRTIINLDDEFTDSDELRRLLDDDYPSCLEKYKNELLDLEPRDPDDGGYYTGYGECARCHPDETRSWLETKHADAFKTLVMRSQDYNPECIPCHATGFGFTGGFTMPGETLDMEGVQCEMCHGPGGNHVEDQSVLLPMEVDESVCRQCHTEEKSPQFDFDTYYIPIAH